MTRHRPANRRSHETIAIEHEGQRYKIGLGRDVMAKPSEIDFSGEDISIPVDAIKLGPIVEVFCNAQQVNSTVDVLVGDGAILISLLLQHGCPPATIFHAMKRNPDGTAASPLGRAAAYLVEEQGEP
jgi:hypothetical protein